MDRMEQFLVALEEGSIHYQLERIRPGSIAVMVAVPGQRWEVEFMTSGEVEVEVFTSDGTIHDEGALPDLLARFAD